MKANIKFIIYLLGVAILGFIYYPLKEALSSWLLVLVAIGYLLILRMLAEYIHKRIVGKEGSVVTKQRNITRQSTSRAEKRAPDAAKLLRLFWSLNDKKTVNKLLSY